MYIVFFPGGKYPANRKTGDTFRISSFAMAAYSAEVELTGAGSRLLVFFLAALRSSMCFIDLSHYMKGWSLIMVTYS